MLILVTILFIVSCFISYHFYISNEDLKNRISELQNKPIDNSNLIFAQNQNTDLNKKLNILHDQIRQIEIERLQFIQETNAQFNTSLNKELDNWKNTELVSLRENEKRIALDEANLKLENYIKDFETDIRKDAISKSKSVNLGKITEHLIPFFPDFPFDSTECRFLGSPIDLICFFGLSKDKVEKVIFVEIKTGKSALSKREKSLKEAIINKQVEWIELRNNYEAKNEN